MASKTKSKKSTKSKSKGKSKPRTKGKGKARQNPSKGSKVRAKVAKKKSTSSDPNPNGAACILTRGRDPQVVAKMLRDYVAGDRVNVNDGVYSVTEWERMVAEYKAGKADYLATGVASKKPASLPYLSIPAIHRIASEQGLNFVVRGHPNKQEKAPKGWSDRVYGPHRPGIDFDRFRCNYLKDVRLAVENPEQNIITVGKTQYVLGINCINPARSGNGEANHGSTKFNCHKDVPNGKFLVGQINRDVVEEVLEPQKHESKGATMSWLPNTRVAWGFLEKGGKKQTHDQLRKNDGNGLKFVALKKPIIGKPMNEASWWSTVKSLMSRASTKDKVVKGKGGKPDTGGKTAMERWEKKVADDNKRKKQNKTCRGLGMGNMQTATRNDPNVAHCFGWRGAQCGLSLYSHFAPSIKDVASAVLLYNIAIGARLTFGLSETMGELKKRLAPATKPAKKKVEKKVTEKAEKTKTTAKKKTTKKKTTKKKTTKKKTTKKKDKGATTLGESPPITSTETEAAATTDLSNDVDGGVDVDDLSDDDDTDGIDVEQRAQAEAEAQEAAADFN